LQPLIVAALWKGGTYSPERKKQGGFCSRKQQCELFRHKGYSGANGVSFRKMMRSEWVGGGDSAKGERATDSASKLENLQVWRRLSKVSNAGCRHLKNEVI